MARTNAGDTGRVHGHDEIDGYRIVKQRFIAYTRGVLATAFLASQLFGCTLGGRFSENEWPVVA